MTTNLIHAPWTAEQVTALNAFQHHGRMHPFTCGAEHATGQSPVLVATNGGWVCPDPQCVYRQDWAHAFMAEPAGLAVGLGVSATPSHTSAPTAWTDGHPQLEAIAAAVYEQCEHSGSGLIIDDPRNIAVAALDAVLPPPADRAAVIAEVLPAWEAVYEPGNVSDYLIGYANDQDAATGMAEAWMRSQAEVTGRLEWVSEERMATGRYDQWFELIERHDGGIDTGPGIIVRRRLADEAQQPTTERRPSCEHEAQYHDVDGRCWFTVEQGVFERDAVCSCQLRRPAADEPVQEPPVHGESVAHLAGLHDGHDQWGDDAQAGFVPPAAEGLPSGALDSARNGATMLDAWAEDPHGRNFLAHALVQLARDGWLRTEPGEGFEPVSERDDVPEPQDPADLAAVDARQDGAPS